MQEILIFIFLAMLVSSDNQKYYWFFFKKANFKQLSEFRHENNKFILKSNIVSVSQKKVLLLSNRSM